MATELVEIPQIEVDAPRQAGPVQRRPFYLKSHGNDLFALLHTGPNEDFAQHGVVICPPIGVDQLHAHRGLRHLADQLAQSGIPTLRFDWHGTGDSAGNDLDVDRLSTWLNDVRSAVRWMRDQNVCRNVSVVGLRSGALIAALALDQDEIENLVLWAPVITGRSFVRELTAIQMMSDLRPKAADDSSGNIQSAGFVMSGATATSFQKCCLLQSRPRAQRILVVTRDDAATDNRLEEHFHHLGIAVEERALPGMPQMLIEPHRSQLPEQAIGEITSWLRQQTNVDSPNPTIVREQSDFKIVDAMPQQCELAASGCDSPVIRESICRLSQSPDLVGIISEPVTISRADLPTIVMLNAGAAYRIGPGRMNVEMCRHLAAQGFRCLRIDLCGLGDSVTGSVVDENQSYSATAFRDIQITLRELQRRFGVQKCVLMGLCSGAYNAFQSAAQLTDPMLVESLLINPLTFFWQDGLSLEAAPSRQMITQHYYLRSALQPSKWLRLLSGKSQIGFRGALRLIVQRVVNQRLLWRRRPMDLNDRSRDNVPSHPATQDLPADLDQIVRRGRHLSMFFATSDPGYGILKLQAARTVNRMVQRQQLDLQFIDQADHTFSDQSARRELIQSITEHLSRRYLADGPQGQ